MITTDEAIDLLCVAKGDDSPATKRAARVALLTAAGVITAQGGEGWDFEREWLTLTTTASAQDYYVNKKPVGTTDSLTLDKEARVGVIHDIWYSTTHVKKETRHEFRYHYQGETATGTPKRWTAWGNLLQIGPVPGGAYALNIEVTRLPRNIEEFPENKQFAVIYTAIRLMFPPTKDFQSMETVMQIVVDALRASDGLMDFGDWATGGGL